MSVFTLRHQGYKAGVFLLFLAFFVYLVGYASPYWATADLDIAGVSSVGISTKLHEGLHMYCASATVYTVSTTSCAVYGISGYPGYFHAVRALAVFGFIGLLISAIIALATNCCRSVPNAGVSRILEIFTGISAILCLCACIVYGAMRNDKDAARSISGGLASQALAYFLGSQEWTLDWAFYLAVIGSILALLAAILIGVFNKELQAAPQGMVMAPVVTGAPYVVTQTSYGHQSQPQQYYPPQAAGYNPPQAGYNPPQAGYNPPQAGYNPPQKQPY